MSSRVGYFKNVDQASVDADQASAILSLQGSITTINTSLASKADASALSDYALASDVATSLALKANTSALSNYALSSDMTTALNNKANASDLADVVTDVSALQTKDAAINSFVLALSEVLYVSNADNTAEYDYSAFE
jgi:hypothetical protein